jgi:two-component system, NarL family, invasion response regulator UvrY
MNNNDANADVIARLSRRELEVLTLVVEGRTSREIAAILGVKPASIQTYRSRLMAKLETRSIATLVRLAIRRGLINL